MLGIALGNPMIWAVLVGWIISVVLHEFAHGLVAHLGGDYTISERGGLSLNPLQYVDPLYSIIFPAVMLMMGGIPLPGGSTYVRRDLLRSRAWDSAVSLAGPGMNILLFFVCVLPLHQAFGWVRPGVALTPPQVFLGAMAVLQMLAALFNLVPVPPLDGFQALAPYLPHDLQQRLSSRAVGQMAFFIYFMVLWNLPGGVIGHLLRSLIFPLLTAMGFNDVDVVRRCYNLALFGHTT